MPATVNSDHRAVLASMAILPDDKRSLGGVAKAARNFVGIGGACKEKMSKAIATDTEPEKIVGLITHIVCNRGGLPGLENAPGALRKIALETAAADQPLIVGINPDEDALPGF